MAACEYIDGVWIGQEKSDEPVFLRYAGQGRIQAVAAQPSGREAPEQAVTVAILSIHEDALYLNWIVEEMQGIEPGYCVLRLFAVEPDTAILCCPNAEYFADAVEQRRIPGTVDRTRRSSVGSFERLEPSEPPVPEIVHPETSELDDILVFLGGSKDQLDALIRKSDVDRQFMVDRPFVLRRIAELPQ